MSDEKATGLKIVKLLSGLPQKCPKCAGWGFIGEGEYPCPECRGQRTMRLAEVHGTIMVPIETKQGDELSA